MNLKRLISRFAIIIAVCFATLPLASCDDDASTSNILGTWYATFTYNNPVAGKKSTNLEATFNANNTGEIIYDSSVVYSVFEFTYKIKGNIIQCQGVKVDSNGDIEYDYMVNIKIEGDRLIPQNHYTNFILTRDGSVITSSTN